MEEQIRRITEAERALTRAQKAVDELTAAWEAYRAVEDDIALLEKYLNSPERRRDLDADEQGNLPEKIPRGVLSEDGIWDLLERNSSLRRDISREIGSFGT